MPSQLVTSVLERASQKVKRDVPVLQKGGAYPGSMLDFAPPSPTKEISSWGSKAKFFMKTLDGGEEERKSLVSARSDTSEVKSSENEWVRLDRLEIILSALLSEKFGPDPSLNSLHNSQVKGPSRKHNCIFNKTKNNSVGLNGDLASGLIFELNLNGSLAFGLNKNNCLNIGLSTKNKVQNYTKWVLDSDAIDHMTGNQTLLKNYRTIISGQYFTVANNEQINIKGCGVISIFSKKILQDVFMLRIARLIFYMLANFLKN
jgi:hypothetical protein